MQDSKRRGERKEGRRLLRESERIESTWGAGLSEYLASAGVRKLSGRDRLLLQRGVK